MTKRLLVIIILLSTLGSYAKLPNFAAIHDSTTRKHAFFNYLLPKINLINARIKKEREQLSQLYQAFKTHRLNTQEKKRLTAIASHYAVSDISSETAWQTLFNRVDIIPPSMVLAQAANESAWGTSRFAQQGANLFGQWCHQKGCGLIPKRRTYGMHHEVRVFNNALDSIASYMNNLNTNKSYMLFRKLRAKMRTMQQPANGFQLAQGLEKYSERGQAYVKEIRSMIKINRLIQFDTAL